MLRNKKQMYIIIGAFAIVLILFTTTYAFFNYTRTGTTNNIRVGKIYFNSEQTTINLNNVFPISSSDANTDKTNTDELTITITGDTTYSNGIEYLLTIVDVNNIISDKKIPISIVVSASDGLGISDDDYYVNRGGNDSLYKSLSDNINSGNEELFVGYIASGNDGVDGTISIKAFIDKDKIAISDTYPSETIISLNSNVSNEDVENCVSYFTENNYSNFYSGESLENFCSGTGTLYGDNIQAWIDNQWFSNNEINELVRLNILNRVDNETTNEWVNGRVVLTTTEWNSLQNTGISFKVKVEANEGLWVDNPKLGYKLVKKALDNYDGNNEITVIDDMGTTNDTSDDIIYFSGNNSDIDMNYVWYSGKLWRITAIYPDNTMKLVTQDIITTMNYGNSTEFNGSWIYQWLNEDFYDTLYNQDNIIATTTWNYTSDNSMGDTRPENLNNQKTVTTKVGMLNAYELKKSYQSTSNYNNGFLKNGYKSLLINSFNNSTLLCMDAYGYVRTDSLSVALAGVRPAIIIKSSIVFDGNGTYNDPYTIVNDIEKPISNATLINSRLSGEYVNFDNELYRIVETNSDGTTRITKMTYVKSNNVELKKKLASSIIYGKAGNTLSDDYWDYYLNNTWYNSISSTYKNMLTDSTYYLGTFNISNSYKQTICKNNNLDEVTIKNCSKYTSDDEDKTFVGKVGIGRVGEMFTAQHEKDYSNSQIFLIITPDTTNNIISRLNTLYSSSNSNDCAYPTITLKSGIKIASGLGTESSPFEIIE